MDDFGVMASFELDATLEETADVVSNTEVFTLAESPGGTSRRAIFVTDLAQAIDASLR